MLALVILSGVLSGCTGKTEAADDELLFYVLGSEAKDTPDILLEANKILKEKVGATLKFKYLDTNSYDLALSSGEKCDLVFAPDWLNCWENAGKGAFAEITDEELKANAPYIWENGQNYVNVFKVNGVRYGIPAFREEVPNRCFAARGDLMDKYGIETIENMDDIEKYLDAVAKNEKNIIPYDIPGTAPWNLVGYWASDWGWAAVGSLSYGEHVYFRIDDPERKLFIAAEQPEMIEFSKRMKKWHDNGYFSKSVLSNKTSSQDSFENGRSALAWVSNGLSGCEYLYQTFQKDDRKAWDVRFFPAYSKTQRMYNVMNQSVSVSATSENKEKCLRVLNEIYSNEELYRLLKYGKKGVHYDIDSSGKRIELDSDSYSPMFGLTNPEFDIPQKYEFPGVEELTAKLESYVKFDPVVNCRVDYTEVREIKTALDEIFNTYTTARCYGMPADVEAAMKKEVEALKTAGIDKYIEMLQKCVDEFMKEIK